MLRQATKYLVFTAVLLAGGGVALGFWLRGDEQEVLRLPGTVEIQEVRLGSRVGGRVKEIYVAEGDVVEAGQLLVGLDNPEVVARRNQTAAQLQAALAELDRARTGSRPEEKAEALAALEAAEARLARLEAGARSEEIEQARGELDSVVADLRVMQTEWERMQRLSRSPAVTDADIESSRGSYQRTQGRVRAARAHLALLEAGTHPKEIAEAKAEVARLRAIHARLEAGTRSEDLLRAEARVAELRAHLEEMEAQLKEARITAPEKAVVDVLAVRKGDMVSPEQAVVRVLRAADLWVKVYVPETRLGKVRMGQEVKLTIDSYPGRLFTGTVVHVASQSEFTPRNVQSADERRHQVFGVKVRVQDSEGIFKAGLAAEVIIPLID